MKKSVLFLSGIALLMLTGLTSCKNDDDGYVAYMLPETKAVNLTVDQKALVSKNNDFAFNLVRNIYGENENGEDKGKSIFVSPLGVTSMIGMLNSGANDAGSREISKALGIDGTTASQLNEFCKSVMEQARKVDKQVTLEMANGIFVNKQFSLTSEYVGEMSKYYNAKAASLDFNAESSLSSINGWTKNLTHGMVPQAVDKVSPSCVAYVLNAMYFSAPWTKQFDREKNHFGSFLSRRWNSCRRADDAQ